MKRFSFMYVSIALVLCFLFAFARLHIRLSTTMIGYEIGRLKDRESTLLEQRSVLQMHLAKLTTRKHLAMMADIDERLIGNSKPLAAK